MIKIKSHLYFIIVIILLGSSLVFASSNNQETNTERYKGSGDRKQGYDKDSYVTNSLSLEKRTGKEANLLQFAQEAPLGLPNLKIPLDNPIDANKINLGRRLFFDRRLSLNDTFSCAICHVPEQGFTSNELSTAIGVEGRSIKRNSPTMYNVAYYSVFFHDGRETTLEQQAWSPLLAQNEMANPSIGYVLKKLKAIKDYEGLFENAFAGKGPTMETVGMALASYQRTLNSGESKFDQWYFGKKDAALSADEKAGFELFTGKGSCSSCHIINDQYALFTDNQFHNTGHGYAVSMAPKPEKVNVQLAPGVFVDVDYEIIKSVSQRTKANDVGLYEVTQNPNDRWKFRTASLRNIELTAPYMHDGAFKSIREVVEFYNHGGVSNELLSPLIKPLNLTEKEIDNLVAFLHALTGNNIQTIVADAFSAPIGDLKTEDPNWAHEAELTN
ncbi:MAG: hypothetical protein GKR92_03690 [Gammaproteobacteria bacterium]|nr:MAG: hypothetical protein GKR92_03690 [Gammaproteobacteria bacterium]